MTPGINIKFETIKLLGLIMRPIYLVDIQSVAAIDKNIDNLST